MSDNLSWGIITVSICTAGYSLAFRKAHKGHYTIALMLLVVCGLLLRIYTSLDPYLHAWDERYHALVAKHLLQSFLHPVLYDRTVIPLDYKNYTNSHIWLHKQPLTLWLMAVSLKLFGIHAWAVRVPSIIMSSAGIKLTYDVGRYLYNRKIALLAAFLFSIHGVIIDLTSGRTPTDHVDLAFLFFILLSIWCGIKNAEKKSYVWAMLTGMSMGCAILCKWLPAIIVLPVWALIFYQGQRDIKSLVINLLVIVLAATAVALPWQLYICHEFPVEAAWEYKYNSMHIWAALDKQSGNWLYHFDCLRMNFGELIYLPVIWFSIKACREKKIYNLAIATWFWVPYIFFSFCATKMRSYTIFAAPAIFIITSDMYYYLIQLYRQPGRWRWLYVIIACGLIVLPIRYGIERVKPFNNDHERYPQWEKNIETFKASASNTPYTVVFNTAHSTEMMFETDCVAYPALPDSATIHQLTIKGYNVIIWPEETPE